MKLDSQFGKFGQTVPGHMITEGRDYSFVQDSVTGVAIKTYTEALTQGCAGL